MTGGVKSAVWRNHHVVSESDFCAVENHDVDVGVEFFVNLYIVAVIILFRLFYVEHFLGFSKEFFD